MIRKFALFCAAIVLTGCGSTGIGLQQAWQVERVEDPVTGIKRCVVAAYDQSAGLSYTRVGALYPFVENNSKFGILVGVSSGGPYRLPVGIIFWRVDDKPFRQINPADNPPGVSDIWQPTTIAGLSKETQDAIAASQRSIRGIMQTSAVASGNSAKELLAELSAGKSLVFRAAAASSDFGIPSANTYAVGQITAQGLRPIPIDESFRTGLVSCGIQ